MVPTLGLLLVLTLSLSTLEDTSVSAVNLSLRNAVLQSLEQSMSEEGDNEEPVEQSALDNGDSEEPGDCPIPDLKYHLGHKMCHAPLGRPQCCYVDGERICAVKMVADKEVICTDCRCPRGQTLPTEAPTKSEAPTAPGATRSPTVPTTPITKRPAIPPNARQNSVIYYFQPDEPTTIDDPSTDTVCPEDPALCLLPPPLECCYVNGDYACSRYTINGKTHVCGLCLCLKQGNSASHSTNGLPAAAATALAVGVGAAVAAQALA